MQYVNFPENFVQTKYSGYFVCLKTNWLYSIKIDGILKRLCLHYPNKFNKMKQPYYQLSVSGKKIYFTESDIIKIVKQSNNLPSTLLSSIQVKE